MKKLLVVLLALLTIGAALSAEIKLSAWGRFFMVPYSQVNNSADVGGTNPDPTVNAGPGWGGKGRVGFQVNGVSDNVGFQLNVNSDPSGSPNISIGDQAKIWVKFNDMIKVEGGIVQFDGLRGKIGGNSPVCYNGVGDEDTIFQRIYTGNGSTYNGSSAAVGMVAEIFPADGITIAASLDVGDTGFNNAYSSMQVAAGYKIEGVGLARAQYIGDTKKIQAAFAYTGMAGLTVDASFTMIYDSSAQNIVVAAASYSKDALAAMVRTKVLLPATIGGVDKKLDLGLHGYGQYKIDSLISAGLEFAFPTIIGKTDGGGMVLDASPYIRLGYGNGYFKAAVETEVPLDTNKQTKYQIPLVLEYYF